MRRLRLRETVKPLLLAPAGALSVLAVLLLFFDDDSDYGLGLSTLVLLAYFLIICYLAELLFVVPGLALWPAFRTPHPLVAGAYGVLVAWSLPMARWLGDGHLHWESVGPATVAGAASGLLYGLLTRPQWAALAQQDL